MDPQFTRLYQDELNYLRELGGEFAREHPKIAARLGLDGMEVADPYVERLLEGFAFLAARVQRKLDAEQPQLIAQLLDSMYPQLPGPGAVDDGGAVDGGRERPEPGARLCGAARHALCRRCWRAGRTPRASSAPRWR